MPSDSRCILQTIINQIVKIMKKYLIAATFAGSLFTGVLSAQKSITVPQPVKNAFTQKFSSATHVIWEKENGNYEANWGGKSNEDNMAMFKPNGQFIEVGKAIGAQELPASAITYIHNNDKKASITEVMKITDAKGKVSYEAEVNGKDIVFDRNGNFLKTEEE